MRQVYVAWVDSANLFQDRWAKESDLDDYDEETICETLGFLVKENDHSYFVAGSRAPDEIGSVMQIPKIAVKELRDIRVVLVDLSA